MHHFKLWKDNGSPSYDLIDDFADRAKINSTLVDTPLTRTSLGGNDTIHRSVDNTVSLTDLGDFCGGHGACQ